MKKIKISALPEGDSLEGLYTIGTDANNESVKVSLEFVETAAEAANTAADNATNAASAANTAADNATTAASAANTAADNANAAVDSLAGLVIPTSMELEETITIELSSVPLPGSSASASGVYITPVLSPSGAMSNFIFLNKDDSVCTIDPDGHIMIVTTGSSTVTVIPTFNTSLAKTVTVNITSPPIGI